MMDGLSNDEAATASSNHDAAGVRSKGNTRQDQEQKQQEQQQPPPPSDDIDTSTHASLAAMSATDDVSSMGETYYTGTTASGSRHRKRKDDCSESRCTVTSEESTRSRSRRRRCRSSLMPDQQRWLDRIDRKAATSNAPIRPNRSDDDSFILPPPASATGSTPPPRPGVAAVGSTLAPRFTTAALAAENSSLFQRSMSHSFPTRPGAEFFNSFSTLTNSQAETTRMRGNSCAEARDPRDVARCQSKSLPPVRPTRTRDDSKTDLMKDDSKTDPMKDDSKVTARTDSGRSSDETTDKDEIDPDMYVRLLRGQAPMAANLSPPGLSTARSGGTQTPAAADPPKKPRRRSDADVYMDVGKRKQGHNPSLMRYNTVGSTRDHAGPSSSRACCQSLQRDNCYLAISPKPPAKPFRTIDDIVLENGAAMSQAPTHLAPPLLPKVPRVSEETTTLEDKMTCDSESGHQRRQVLEMSASNRMDLEQEEEGEEEVAVLRLEDGAEQEEDETEVSMPASVKEYDPDLFERLLNGESCAKAAATDSAGPDISEARSINTEEAQPPPPLLARVSTSSGNKAGTPAPPGYNRFDNSASCAMPEHMEGAMKSSHPPMRPRRSFDEGMISHDRAVSLANAAAVACVAGASNHSNKPAPTIMTEPAKRRICIIGGKRRYVRPSRRATLALASELPPSSEDATVPTTDANERNDPTEEVNLVAPAAPPHEFGCAGEIDERDEYVQRVDPMADPNQNDGSYQRILPARRHRRVVRRFTMPSKGRGEMGSPQTKKRRTVGRSLSCRDSSQDGVTPAAA